MWSSLISDVRVLHFIRVTFDARVGIAGVRRALGPSSSTCSSCRARTVTARRWAWESHRGATNDWPEEEVQTKSPWHTDRWGETNDWPEEEVQFSWHGQWGITVAGHGSPLATNPLASSSNAVPLVAHGPRDSTDNSSNRQGHTKLLYDLEAQVQDMRGGLVDLATRMLQTEDTLLSAKEEARAAKERIVILEALVQALEEALAASQHPRAELREAAPHPSPCGQWHEHRPHANHINVSNGEAEGQVDDWLSHLRSTLFQNDTRVLDQLEDNITNIWPDMEVLDCRTKSNRFLYVRCRQCHQFSYGNYGHWATGKDSEAPQSAIDDLAKFFKLEVTCDGRRQV